jgi:hypothetical protein
MALLKVNVDYRTVLIGADMLDSCGNRGKRETPQEQSDEEAP